MNEETEIQFYYDYHKWSSEYRYFQAWREFYESTFEVPLYRVFQIPLTVNIKARDRQHAYEVVEWYGVGLLSLDNPYYHTPEFEIEVPPEFKDKLRCPFG